ncbi:HD-GYP domain-containing protein [bacterium]|nr:HD-GYP domain-containing protein [bacterium]
MEQARTPQSMPNVAAGWGSQPAAPDAKLDNGREVTADIPIHSPVLDELAERSKVGPPVERENSRPLFFERSEDHFHEKRFKEDDRERGSRELLEKSGTLARAFQPTDKTPATKRAEESTSTTQHHQEKVEDVQDQSGRGGGGSGGGQQRERDQQGGKTAHQMADQQQSQSQRRSQSDHKIDLQRLEAYRLAKTDEALKMGLRLAQQPEGKQLSELASRHAGHSMESLLKKAYRLDSLGELNRDDAVNALGLVLKLGGEFTFAHSARVLELAMDLADEVGITDQHTRNQVRLGALLKDTGEMALMLDEAPPGKMEKITDWLGSQDLRQAGLLHDIGKTKVPPEILYKPGKLTEEEYEIMKLHPVIGEEMVYPIESLRHLCPVIRGHHERWDGKGYPDGLKGEDIPYAARIIAVADVFDALAAERPYKAGMPVERVQAILREGRGTHFDPDLLDAFERVIQRRHPELSNPFA